MCIALQQAAAASVSAEDAAREAIQSSELADAQRMALFLAVVRCLNGEVQPAEAASTAGLAPNQVRSAVRNGRALLGMCTGKQLQLPSAGHLPSNVS